MPAYILKKGALLLYFTIPLLNIHCSGKKIKTFDKNTVTFIFTTPEAGVKYNDTTISSIEVITKHQLPGILADEKNSKGEALNIVFKKSPLFSESDREELETLLKKKNITNYVIEDITEKDTELILKLADAFKPPETVEIKTPGSINTSQIPDYPCFFIYIRSNNKIQYKVDSVSNSEPYSEIISLKDSLTLSRAIEKYIGLRTEKETKFFITGDNESNYKIFEVALNMLKRNNIYKYSLLTEQIEKQEEPYLYMPREEK